MPYTILRSRFIIVLLLSRSLLACTFFFGNSIVLTLLREFPISTHTFIVPKFHYSHIGCYLSSCSCHSGHTTSLLYISFGLSLVAPPMPHENVWQNGEGCHRRKGLEKKVLPNWKPPPPDIGKGCHRRKKIGNKDPLTEKKPRPDIILCEWDQENFGLTKYSTLTYLELLCVRIIKITFPCLDNSQS